MKRKTLSLSVSILGVAVVGLVLFFRSSVVHGQTAGPPVLSNVPKASGKLTRQKAEVLIRSTFGLGNKSPKHEGTTTLLLSWNGVCNGRQTTTPCGPGDLDAETNALIAGGLVTVAFDGNTSRLSLTPKAQQYAAGKPEVQMMGSARASDGTAEYRTIAVWLSTVEFGTITGIREAAQFNAATVEYTVITKATPFGNRPLGYSMVYGNNNQVATGTIAQTINFTKYDDGWRISR